MEYLPEDRKQKAEDRSCQFRPPSSVLRHPNRHAGHRTSDFLVKFWVSLILTIPVVLYSELPERLGLSAPAFPGSQFLPLVLSSIVFFYGGWIFLASAVRELKAKLPGMMTLIALAITAAYSYSVSVTLTGSDHTLFWELTTLITVMLLGHWIEMRAVQGAQGALGELAKLLPDEAEVLLGNQESGIKNYGKLETKLVALSELKIGELVLVRPGGKIPTDGAVIEGTSDVNEAMVTGESKLVAKESGSSVIAGTINGDGTLTIKVTKIGEETFLAGVMRLVRNAQASKSRLQMLSDRAAYYLTLVAITIGGITFITWLALDGLITGVERAVAVLVIACPHALGLAIPLVASISTSLAARNGFLVRQRLALEAARNVDVVLFDKTGTLTKGEYGVVSMQAIGPDADGSESRPKRRDDMRYAISEEEILRLAASVDQKSEHVVAKAIVAEAQKRGLKLAAVTNFQRLPGKGVKGTVAGKEVIVGGEAVLSPNLEKDYKKTRPLQSVIIQPGVTVVYVAIDSEVVGAIGLADQIREESREAVAALKDVGVEVAMVTGDSEPVAQWVAKELGIGQVFAQVLPDQKVEIVRRLQNSKHETRNSKQIQNSNHENAKQFRISDFGFRISHERQVAFVGDGINDAPALTQADVGIAIGAGTNVAIESAGIILVRNDPRDIPKIIQLSRATIAKMLQNLWWASGYNIIALPLAAGVLANQGIVLQPAVSALLMSLSTVIVAVNAVLLRRVDLKA